MKFLESLYSKVFVNIVVTELESHVYIEVCPKKDVIQSYEKKFVTLNFNAEMIEFIDSYIKDTPFYYIAVLDNSLSQGAIPSCSKDKRALYKDLSACEFKCQNSMWMYYTAKADIYEIEKRYEKRGVDFIFSPFSVLSRFFKDKIELSIAAFLLIQEESIVFTVFENSELLYGEYINMMNFEEEPQEVEALEEELEELEDIDLNDDEEGIDLDDMSALDEMDSLDDFGDIEDLEDMEEIDEFSQTEDVEEEFYEEPEDVPSQESDDSFSQDFQRFSLVQKAINTFYHDDKYQSKFIENVYIADSVGITAEFKRYFEEEMFMNVYVRQILISSEVAELARLEVMG